MPPPGLNPSWTFSKNDWPALRPVLTASPLPKPCAFHSFKVDRAQVRHWAIENHLAHAVPPKRILAPVRRWQRSPIGELWQLDASPHRWFPHSKIVFPMLNLLVDCSRLFTGSKLYERELLLSYFDFLPAAFLASRTPAGTLRRLPQYLFHSQSGRSDPVGLGAEVPRHQPALCAHAPGQRQSRTRTPILARSPATLFRQ